MQHIRSPSSILRDFPLDWFLWGYHYNEIYHFIRYSWVSRWKKNMVCIGVGEYFCAQNCNWSKINDKYMHRKWPVFPGELTRSKANPRTALKRWCVFIAWELRYDEKLRVKVWPRYPGCSLGIVGQDHMWLGLHNTPTRSNVCHVIRKSLSSPLIDTWIEFKISVNFFMSELKSIYLAL